MTLQAAKRRCFLLFRNDLRLHDNEIFRHVPENASVVPLYCFDPRHFAPSEWKTLSWKSRKTGIFRGRFLIETVADLKCSLNNIGSDLLVFHEQPEVVLSELVAQGSNDLVIVQRECTSEEQAVERAVESVLSAKGATFKTFFGHNMFHVDDLPFAADSVPDLFTNMRNMLEKPGEEVPVRELLPGPAELRLPKGFPEAARSVTGFQHALPSLQQLGYSATEIDAAEESSAKAAMVFRGGETAGLARMEEYCDSGLSTYKQTRNGLVGRNYSTKLSAWLAVGALSPRYVYWRIEEFDRQQPGGQTIDTYWVIFELMFRDFFKLFALKHGGRLFKQHGPAGPNEKVPRTWSTDDKVIARWKTGQTGVPYVDACMRELQATGYLSNRGRQAMASYLVYDLGVDWRVGADHFESTLVDHEVCANYGNWAFAAGVATRGQRQNRFNIAKQAAENPHANELVRIWVPELAAIPDALVQKPWELNDEDDAGVVLDGSTCDSAIDRIVAGEVRVKAKVSMGTYPTEPLTRPSWVPKAKKGGGNGHGNINSGGGDGKRQKKQKKQKQKKGRVHRGRDGREFVTV